MSTRTRTIGNLADSVFDGGVVLADKFVVFAWGKGEENGSSEMPNALEAEAAIADRDACRDDVLTSNTRGSPNLDGDREAPEPRERLQVEQNKTVEGKKATKQATRMKDRQSHRKCRQKSPSRINRTSSPSRRTRSTSPVKYITIIKASDKNTTKPAQSEQHNQDTCGKAIEENAAAEHAMQHLSWNSFSEDPKKTPVDMVLDGINGAAVAAWEMINTGTANIVPDNLPWDQEKGKDSAVPYQGTANPTKSVASRKGEKVFTRDAATCDPAIGVATTAVRKKQPRSSSSKQAQRAEHRISDFTKGTVADEAQIEIEQRGDWLVTSTSHGLYQVMSNEVQEKEYEAAEVTYKKVETTSRAAKAASTTLSSKPMREGAELQKQIPIASSKTPSRSKVTDHSMSKAKTTKAKPLAVEEKGQTGKHPATETSRPERKRKFSLMPKWLVKRQLRSKGIFRSRRSQNSKVAETTEPVTESREKSAEAFNQEYKTKETSKPADSIKGKTLNDALPDVGKQELAVTRPIREQKSKTKRRDANVDAKAAEISEAKIVPVGNQQANNDKRCKPELSQPRQDDIMTTRRVAAKATTSRTPIQTRISVTREVVAGKQNHEKPATSRPAGQPAEEKMSQSLRDVTEPKDSVGKLASDAKEDTIDTKRRKEVSNQTQVFVKEEKEQRGNLDSNVRPNEKCGLPEPPVGTKTVVASAGNHKAENRLRSAEKTYRDDIEARDIEKPRPAIRIGSYVSRTTINDLASDTSASMEFAASPTATDSDLSPDPSRIESPFDFRRGQDTARDIALSRSSDETTSTRDSDSETTEESPVENQFSGASTEITDEKMTLLNTIHHGSEFSVEEVPDSKVVQTPIEIMEEEGDKTPQVDPKRCEPISDFDCKPVPNFDCKPVLSFDHESKQSRIETVLAMVTGSLCGESKMVEMTCCQTEMLAIEWSPTASSTNNESSQTPPRQESGLGEGGGTDVRKSTTQVHPDDSAASNVGNQTLALGTRASKSVSNCDEALEATQPEIIMTMAALQQICESELLTPHNESTKHIAHSREQSVPKDPIASEFVGELGGNEPNKTELLTRPDSNGCPDKTEKRVSESIATDLGLDTEFQRATSPIEAEVVDGIPKLPPNQNYDNTIGESSLPLRDSSDPVRDITSLSEQSKSVQLSPSETKRSVSDQLPDAGSKIGKPVVAMWDVPQAPQHQDEEVTTASASESVSKTGEKISSALRKKKLKHEKLARLKKFLTKLKKQKSPASGSTNSSAGVALIEEYKEPSEEFVEISDDELSAIEMAIENELRRENSFQLALYAVGSIVDGVYSGEVGTMDDAAEVMSSTIQGGDCNIPLRTTKPQSASYSGSVVRELQSP